MSRKPVTGRGDGDGSSRTILRMPSLIAQLIETFCDPNEVSNHRNGILFRFVVRAGR